MRQKNLLLLLAIQSAFLANDDALLLPWFGGQLIDGARTDITGAFVAVSPIPYSERLVQVKSGRACCVPRIARFDSLWRSASRRVARRQFSATRRPLIFCFVSHIYDLSILFVEILSTQRKWHVGSLGSPFSDRNQLKAGCRSPAI